MGGFWRNTGRKGAGAALVGALLAVGLVPTALAQTVEEFYRGNVITILVGGNPGGGYDLTARLLARHMASRIPGEPTIIVENIPGAGGAVAVTRLYGQAARDGTALGLIRRSFAVDPILNPEAQNYDPAAFRPIGSTSTEVFVAAVWHEAGVRTIEDLQTWEINAGATAATDGSVRYAMLARNLADANINIIPGYGAGTDVTLAMERGEVDARFGWSWGSLKARSSDWLDQELIHIVLQFGAERAPDLPDVPSILDFAETELDRQALQLLFSPEAYAWPLVTAPGVPQDRVDALRAAFDETVADPAFIEEAQRLEIEVEPVTGERMEELINELLSFDETVVARAIELTTPQN